MPNRLNIRIVAFDDMTLRELHAVLLVRSEVFVVEQKICQVAEVDAEDTRCLHVIAQLNDKIIGTARLLPVDDAFKVGRVAVLTEQQGAGIGSAMMRAIHDWLDGRLGKMSAQAHLEKWYTGLGWQRGGEVYEEAGLPHIDMRYDMPRDG